MERDEQDVVHAPLQAGVKAPSQTATIIYAKWDELNEDAIEAAFVGDLPDVPIFVWTEEMTTDEWLEGVRRDKADSKWTEGRGGTFCAFPAMHDAKRIHVADRPRR